MLMNEDTVKFFTIPYVDENGDFYCRIVHSILHEQKNQHVCGIGCPYYDGLDEDGKVKCKFLEKQPKEKPEALKQKVEALIASGKEGLFPAFPEMDPMLWKAYDYAAQMHYGQNRKGTDNPYFTHLITTMNYAMELTKDIDILSAAVLHDTLEDTYATLLELQIRFGSKVAFYVASETENKRIGLPAAETWEARKKENIDHLQNASLEVKIIVLSDKTANAESMAREWAAEGEVIWQKFNQKDKRKQGWYYRSCEEAMKELSDTNVMKCFRAYLGILFGD